VILIIEPGTVIRFRKFTEGRIGMYVNGTLISQGAVFTTSCDFEDLDESYDYDWHSIELFGGPHIFEHNEVAYTEHGIHCESGTESTISSNTFTKCVSNGVWTNSSSVTITDNTFIDCGNGVAAGGASPTITNNTIQDCYNGIDCNGSSPTINKNKIIGCSIGINCYSYYDVPSSPIISYNNIADCTDGIYIWIAETLGSSPTINYNCIYGNDEYGVYNEDCSVTIDAENNWWGHETGPYHPETNPDGQGDAVSDCVDFEPWLTECPLD